MDTAQWTQGIAIKSMGVVEVSESSRPILEEKRGRPLIKDQALNCPRCNSTTTKFCYYNNYSLSQPRYFCKACKRYWTQGGSLRNVPVGGASRKNKRSSSSSSYSSPSSSSKIKLAHHHDLDSQSPDKDTQQEQGQDLNLAYPPTSDYDHHGIFNPSSSSPHALSAMEMIKINGINASRGLMSSFMNPISLEGSNINHGFSNLQEFNKPTSLSFSLDGYANSGYGSRQGVDTSHDQDLKQMPSSTTTTSSRGEGDQAGVYWNGMVGGGSW